MADGVYKIKDMVEKAVVCWRAFGPGHHRTLRVDGPISSDEIEKLRGRYWRDPDY